MVLGQNFNPLAGVENQMFRTLWALWLFAGLLLLGFNLHARPALPVQTASSTEDANGGTNVDSGPTLGGAQPREVCGEVLEDILLLELGSGAAWDDPVDYEEYVVRYRQVASSSLRLDRRLAVVSKRSDRTIVGLAEVMNVDTGCYWDWAESTRMLSTIDDKECALEAIFENQEIKEIFPQYQHYAFLGVASRPGTEYIDYLKLTRVRADNLLTAAARAIPESLRSQSAPLVLGLGRSSNRRQKGSIAEKRERSAYVVGVRECIAELGAKSIISIVLNTAEVSDVKFSKYSHAPGVLDRIVSQSYNPLDPFKDWKSEDRPQEKP